jgi:REP element-mobilizing transposase RayT
MPLDLTKGYQALRRGRHSTPGASYFITFCTADRATGLTGIQVGQAIQGEWHVMENDGQWIVRCATIMPDHLHLLIELGAKLTLGKAVARIKSRTAAALRSANLAWQSGYFDHRLRPGESALPYFHYVYLNPYRAKLMATDAEWPWFFCGPEDRAWFMPHLDRGLPLPEWLADLP